MDAATPFLPCATLHNAGRTISYTICCARQPFLAPPTPTHRLPPALSPPGGGDKRKKDCTTAEQHTMVSCRVVQRHNNLACRRGQAGKRKERVGKILLLLTRRPCCLLAVQPRRHLCLILTPMSGKLGKLPPKSWFISSFLCRLGHPMTGMPVAELDSRWYYVRVVVCLVSLRTHCVFAGVKYIPTSLPY